MRPKGIFWWVRLFRADIVLNGDSCIKELDGCHELALKFDHPDSQFFGSHGVEDPFVEVIKNILENVMQRSDIHIVISLNNGFQIFEVLQQFIKVDCCLFLFEMGHGQIFI